DNITTDHIMPAGAKILPLRSNIPAISKNCFTVCDPEFPDRAEKLGSRIIVGGTNYGQGSSREHAALAPLHLGVKAVLTKSFARIHRANLINAGILPLNFVNESDNEKIDLMDDLVIVNVIYCIKNSKPLTIKNTTKNIEIPVTCELSERAIDIVLAGGLLSYTKSKLN
ncbi:MAG: aconitate hydratase, partial [Clostridia bacterium]|nr:aconitate hydratase [Clostridia bacterium]